MSTLQGIRIIVDLIIQAFVIFPYSALIIQRQRRLTARETTNDTGDESESATMISEKLYMLCTSKESVSALLAADPTLAPGDAWKKLYGDQVAGDKQTKKTAQERRGPATPDDIQRSLECGNWGPTKPSELFLQMYHDALCTLDNDVAASMVSPSLMGSHGVIPLTVISVVPDIMRHMSNIIVRAEKEVILATNYWVNSVASKYITNAMKELSRRAGERGEKIVFKLEYDRGSLKQVLDPHYTVPEKEYLGAAVALPCPDEIPNLDMQVINYHRPLLGTFHCKYMVVDRKYAVLQSNNIQDNDNLEMMTHLEGPIVDSIYDMALISWHKKLEPPLPSHNSPAVQGEIGSFGDKSHETISGQVGLVRGHSASAYPENMKQQHAYSYEPRAITQPGVVQPQISNHILTGPSTNEGVSRPVGVSEVSQTGAPEDVAQIGILGQRVSSNASPAFTSEILDRTGTLKENTTAIISSGGDVEHTVHAKRGYAQPKSADVNQAATETMSKAPVGPDSKTQEFLSSGQPSLPQIQIEYSSFENTALPEHTTDDPHYDFDIAGEVARVQAAVSPKQGGTRAEAVTSHLNHTKNVGFKGNAPECAPHEEMMPFILHAVHEPFPIAMACREPYGSANHHSVYNPQNEAWLSALRNAKRNVFIQSPTLNAEPLVPAIIEACERGIDVYCYICLGYNDTGELLPMQGGTNEMIAHKMYTSLSKEGKQRLYYFFYIGKDQTAPIVAKKKKRSCHVKVMIVDEHIGIQGNGNQDTQSWYHSQEINVMFDSALVCKGWIDGLRRNQNTHIYGEVSKEDGIWRDVQGNPADDVIGVDPGRFSWARGFLGAINRVRGTGDF